MLMVTGVTLVTGVSLAVWFSSPQLRARLGLRNFFAAAVLAAWTVGAASSAAQHTFFGKSESAEQSELMSAVRALGQVDWNGTASRENTSAQSIGRPAAIERATAVAPVTSLLSGLEARLAADPADAKGWALLAQSYAFVGNSDGAEQAVSKAVALGFDEPSLRERVSQSAREVHSSNWIEDAVRR